VLREETIRALNEGGNRLCVEGGDHPCVEGGRKPSIEREETVRRGRETIRRERGHCDGWEEAARGL
jgi:hypothetical protein